MSFDFSPCATTGRQSARTSGHNPINGKHLPKDGSACDDEHLVNDDGGTSSKCSSVDSPPERNIPRSLFDNMGAERKNGQVRHTFVFSFYFLASMQLTSFFFVH